MHICNLLTVLNIHVDFIILIRFATADYETRIYSFLWVHYILLNLSILTIPILFNYSSFALIGGCAQNNH